MPPFSRFSIATRDKGCPQQTCCCCGFCCSCEVRDVRDQRKAHKETVHHLRETEVVLSLSGQHHDIANSSSRRSSSNSSINSSINSSSSSTRGCMRDLSIVPRFLSSLGPLPSPLGRRSAATPAARPASPAAAAAAAAAGATATAAHARWGCP